MNIFHKDFIYNLMLHSYIFTWATVDFFLHFNPIDI